MNFPPSITPSERSTIASALKEPYRLIFDISCITGLRIGDILSLTGYQIDVPMIVTESKTKKTKVCHLPGAIIGRLWKQCWNPSGPIFASRRDPTKRIHRTTVYRALKEAGERVGIKVTPHTGRKFYAQEVYRLTGDIQQVQQALNHKYITTTATYLDIDLTAMLRACKPPIAQ